MPSLGFGLHDATRNRTVRNGTVRGEVSDEYRWVSFGRFPIPTGRYFFYFKRKWYLQLPIAVPGMSGRNLEMKGLIEFGADEIRLARIVFVE